MRKLKGDLKGVTKELKALTKKTERMANRVAKLEKAQSVKKPKVKPRPKVKKAPVKKGVAAKKAKATTATDQVVNMIKRSKKGVDVPTLLKKTGFDDKKVRNIITRACKQGKVKRAGRGIYVAA